VTTKTLVADQQELRGVAKEELVEVVQQEALLIIHLRQTTLNMNVLAWQD
jgi:hypothetical protein